MEPVQRILLWSLVVLVWTFTVAVILAILVERLGIGA